MLHWHFLITFFCFQSKYLVCKFGFLVRKLYLQKHILRHAKKKNCNQKVFSWKPHFPSKIDAVENFQAALYLTFLDQNSVFGLREAHRGFLLLLLGCLFFHSWHLPAFPAIFNLVIILAFAAFYCSQNASSHWTQLAGICANSFKGCINLAFFYFGWVLISKC